MLGSAERDVALASACASNAECKPATANEGMKLPWFSFLLQSVMEL